MKTTILNIALTVACAAGLSACGSGQKNLYYWGDYTKNVYERLKDNGKPAGEQIDKMEKYFQKASDSQKSAAPGAHAHMGLLLIDAGQNQQALAQFEKEKQLFPESGSFMDFLLKNAKGKK